MHIHVAHIISHQQPTRDYLELLSKTLKQSLKWFLHAVMNNDEVDLSLNLNVDKVNQVMIAVKDYMPARLTDTLLI